MADPAPATLPSLGDDQAGAGVEILADVLDPVPGPHPLRAGGVLQPHLGEHGELAGELAHVAGLLFVAEGHGPI